MAIQMKIDLFLTICDDDRGRGVGGNHGIIVDVVVGLCEGTHKGRPIFFMIQFYEL